MQQKSEKKRAGRVIPFERDGEFFLRLGSQRLERNDLLEALSNYQRAFEKEPENIETQLAMAEVLTEMRRYEQSNQLLFPMLSLQESPSECFFGIACNFLGLQEFPHARDSLESYLALDPEGEFVSDALDMLDILEDPDALYTMPGVQPPDEREAANACARGRMLLEAGRLDESIELLEQTAEAHPGMVFVHNNISLAYFCDKEYGKAMESVQRVLEESPKNVQAHCNLLLYLHAARDAEGVQRELTFLKNCETQDPQDWSRLAVVFMELGEYEDALALFKRLHVASPYDEGTLHRLAICRYKLGSYVLARDCYDRLLKIDPWDTVALYYRRLCQKAMQGKIEKVEWLLHYEVPYIEVLRRVRRINEWSRMEREELVKKWRQDREFRALLRWSLRLPDQDAKRALLSMIASFGDINAQIVLRQFQLDQMQPDAVKQDVFTMLKHLEAREPYIAYLGGSLVQSRVSVRSINKQNMPTAYQRILKICMHTMQEKRESNTIMEAVDIFQKYINHINDLPQLKEQQIYATAAALEYIACRNCGEETTKTVIATQYGVTLLRLKNAINKLLRVLEGIQDDD